MLPSLCLQKYSVASIVNLNRMRSLSPILQLSLIIPMKNNSAFYEKQLIRPLIKVIKLVTAANKKLRYINNCEKKVNKTINKCCKTNKKIR